VSVAVVGEGNARTSDQGPLNAPSRGQRFRQLPQNASRRTTARVSLIAGTAPPFGTYASDIPRPRGVGKSMLGPSTYWHGFVGGTPRKQSFRGRHDADLIRMRQLP
jgi:hypothetical protein